ncbi:MAG: hypothetical protein ACR2LC_00170 [Pyrinomonadaceae bacterium]
MKKQLTAMLAPLALLGAFMLPLATQARAAAIQNTPGIDRREARQQRRIERGVRRGRLTRHEVMRLERRESKIQREEDRARSDGRVTYQERRRINRHLNHVNRGLYRHRHNRQRRRY